jgi:hypothetical protein
MTAGTFPMQDEAARQAVLRLSGFAPALDAKLAAALGGGRWTMGGARLELARVLADAAARLRDNLLCPLRVWAFSARAELGAGREPKPGGTAREPTLGSARRAIALALLQFQSLVIDRLAQLHAMEREAAAHAAAAHAAAAHAAAAHAAGGGAAAGEAVGSVLWGEAQQAVRELLPLLGTMRAAHTLPPRAECAFTVERPLLSLWHRLVCALRPLPAPVASGRGVLPGLTCGIKTVREVDRPEWDDQLVMVQEGGSFWWILHDEIERCDGLMPTPATADEATLPILAQGALPPDSRELSADERVAWHVLCVKSLTPLYALDRHGGALAEARPAVGTAAAEGGMLPNWYTLYGLISLEYDARLESAGSAGAGSPSASPLARLLRLCCELSSYWGGKGGFLVAKRVWRWGLTPRSPLSVSLADHGLPGGERSLTRWGEAPPPMPAHPLQASAAPPPARFVASCYSKQEDERTLYLPCTFPVPSLYLPCRRTSAHSASASWPRKRSRAHTRRG